MTYTEALKVYDDLEYFEKNGFWKNATPEATTYKAPEWVIDFAREADVETGHPFVIGKGWKEVARAFKKQFEYNQKLYCEHFLCPL